MSFDYEWWFLTPNGHLDPYKVAYWLLGTLVVAYGAYTFAPV